MSGLFNGMDEETRLLGIDYGEARIGVAITDPLCLFARPHAILQAESDAESLEQIASLVEEMRIVRIVVGLPTDSQSGIGSQALAVILWARRLAALTDVPIVFWDESYSSEAAQAFQKKPRRRSSGRREAIDDLAAAVILQDYLDAGGSQHEPGTPLQAFSHLP
jgi:putative Holliday junction resolvase